MVFERDISSLSPVDVLIQYLRQESNGIENHCISFCLEHLVDVLLRSMSIYQDGIQVLDSTRIIQFSTNKNF